MHDGQQIINDIELFTSTPKREMYEKLFDCLDLSAVPVRAGSKFGPNGFSRHALLRALIVMKCEGLKKISDLLNYLSNNLVIAHLCGFDIFKPLPSYWVFQRFIKALDNALLKSIMQNQVLSLVGSGLIDHNFIALDSTPQFANTRHNNLKCFDKQKFVKSNPPKSDKDCGLGVHTASNSIDNKKTEYYWGYKNHVLVDVITGLPIYEITTTADVADSSVAIDILKSAHAFLPLSGTYFIADKGYDVSDIYDYVKNDLSGLAFIPLNKRNSKKRDTLACGNVICEGGLAMHKDGRQHLKNAVKQKFCCPFRSSKDDSRCPCQHPKYMNGKKNRGCTAYVSTGTNYRASINRESVFFKKIYALRTECERYNARFKYLHPEDVSVRNMNSVQNLNTVAHITLLALAIAAVKYSGGNNYKSVKGFQNSA